ncbi:Golgi apparatus membrane protein tvp18 [Taxawa tesnikishii (nom. ined.)]|nr:Golgi apparatus membrane protein tvp18 [Dothideales sp. JES 119]
MTIAEEFRSRNFSIYGQWTGVLCIILCFALGIANIFHLHWIILFSVICLICSFILLFIEIPLLLRICPTSPQFDGFIRRFETNYMRAAIYLTMSIIQWLSLIAYATSLIAAAVFLLLAAVFTLWLASRDKASLAARHWEDRVSRR